MAHKVKLEKKVFSLNKEKCVFCHLCVTACPVKAIRLSLDQLEIDYSLCLYCGHCWQVCKTEAISLNSQASLAQQLIKTQPTVALLASETIAAFENISPGQLTQALQQLGFIAVEESLLGEEIVAHYYLKYFSQTHSPAIRSTCPAIVNLLAMYYPENLNLLAAVASPAVVQTRLIKLLYPENPAVIYIGPCVAQKAQAGLEIDLALTFSELKELFVINNINPANFSDKKNGFTIKRELSAPGGFPMSFLNYKGNGALVVGHGFAAVQKALSNLTLSPKKRFFDLLACEGCLNGPAFPRAGYLERLQKVQNIYSQNNLKPGFNWQELVPKNLTVSCFFEAKPVKPMKVEPELLNKLLLEVGLTAERQIDCGLCGYESCLKHAEAVLLGYSSWASCLILQRANFQKTTEELLKTSNTDPLTGITNHRGFMNALVSEFNRFKRYETELTVLMIDVDFFKEVNDRYGHLAGDQILKLTAQIFATCLRDTDTAARYGGDEFAVILPETEIKEGLRVAEKLRAKVETADFWTAEKIKTKISLSIGVGQARATDNDAMDLLGRIDKALYQAKQQGRNRVIVAEASC